MKASQKQQDFFPSWNRRFDFEAIPTEGTDQNYVDRWLEKQKKVIEERCSVASLAKKLVAAITAADESSPGVAEKKRRRENNREKPQKASKVV